MAHYFAILVDVDIFAHIVNVVGGRIDGVVVERQFDKLAVLLLAIFHHPALHAIDRPGLAQNRDHLRVIPVLVRQSVAGSQWEV